MIPVNEPRIEAEDVEQVMSCLKDGWISSVGPYVTAFEEAWAKYCERRYGISVSSGTAALEIALLSLDLKPGDEVLVPTFTIISPILAILRAGAVPVLVDSDPTTWTMDVTQLESKRTKKTRAVLPIHIYGHPVEMDPVMAFSKKHGLAVIEDAAEAHGAQVIYEKQWRRCGSFGNLSCFSFYANKLVTTGEGGMVVTDDPTLRDRLASLRNLCFQPPRRFVHEELGHNFRLSNLAAALGLRQIARMKKIVETKRAIASQYQEALGDIEELTLPVEKPWARNVYWMFGTVIDEKWGTAETLSRQLEGKGIQTRSFFCGMHAQPVLQRQGLVGKGTFPVADRLWRQGLYLPTGLTLRPEQIRQVARAVKECVAGKQVRVFGDKYAALYDQVYQDKEYERECDGLVSIFANSGRPIQRVLDLGCGTGNHAFRLAERGYAVVGVDRSAAMISQAQKKAAQTGSPVRFHRGDIGDLDLGEQFDAILMMFAVLGYQTHDVQLRSVLECVRRHLAPQGLILFDVWNGTAVKKLGPSARRKTIETDSGKLVRTSRGELHPKEPICSVDIQTDCYAGEQLISQNHETHQMRYFFREELETLFAQTGLKLTEWRNFPNTTEPIEEMSWSMLGIAQKEIS